MSMINKALNPAAAPSKWQVFIEGDELRSIYFLSTYLSNQPLASSREHFIVGLKGCV